jgi:hypothetical protein
MSKTFIDENGYFRFNDSNKLVHRRVVKKYIRPIPRGYVVHHIDRNKLNNDVDNLEIMSQEEHEKGHEWEIFVNTKATPIWRAIKLIFWVFIILYFLANFANVL